MTVKNAFETLYNGHKLRDAEESFGKIWHGTKALASLYDNVETETRNLRV
jgi:hypothetical protein